MSILDSLYQQVILKHARSNRYYQRAIDASHQLRGDNPFCGDEIQLQLLLQQQQVTAMAYSGGCCAVCSASASMLCEQGEGKEAAGLKQMAEAVLSALQEGGDDSALADDIQALMKVREFPVRVQCAALPWQLLLQMMDQSA